jgi:hypothetical protein
MFFKNGAKIDGLSVVGDDWIQQATMGSKASDRYGFFWWLTSGDPAMWSQRPPFYAQGIFGQHIEINIGKDAVVVIQSAWPNATDRPSSRLSTMFVGAVMEALIEWGQKEKDSVMLTEYVRVALKRHISHRHSSGQNILPAYLLAPAVEDAVRGAVRQTSGGSYLALDPAMSRQLLENIKSTVGDLSRSMHKPVLLTSMDIRRYIRKMIEQDLYELPVLSYQELTQDINIQPLSRVELG